MNIVKQKWEKDMIGGGGKRIQGGAQFDLFCESSGASSPRHTCMFCLHVCNVMG